MLHSSLPNAGTIKCSPHVLCHLFIFIVIIFSTKCRWEITKKLLKYSLCWLQGHLHTQENIIMAAISLPVPQEPQHHTISTTWTLLGTNRGGYNWTVKIEATERYTAIVAVLSSLFVSCDLILFNWKWLLLWELAKSVFYSGKHLESEVWFSAQRKGFLTFKSMNIFFSVAWNLSNVETFSALSPLSWGL